jgi:SAM-dependent methyltransferase
MIKSIALRTRLKDIAYSILTPSVTDSFRNIYSKKDKFFYDKKKANTIRELVDNRRNITNTADDIILLKELHKYFNTINLKSYYEPSNLLRVARRRYKNLISKKIDVKGKDVADFGAGHGENLMMASEFQLNSATGLDYSDINYNSHINEIDPEAFSKIKFITLDLTKDNIGTDQYDIILSFNAFEHFQNPEVVIEGCYKALKKRGILYTEFAAFHAPYAIHRKIYTGVPYIQNIFSDDVAYDFFYKVLKINEEINRYTGVKISDRNPYPEINRWTQADFENLLLEYMVC